MAYHLETLHWKRQLDADSIKDLLLERQAMGLLLHGRHSSEIPAVISGLSTLLLKDPSSNVTQPR